MTSRQPRWSRPLLAAALLATLGFAMAGCESTEEDNFDRRMEMAEKERELKDAPVESDMPADRAAEVCVTTAKELEAKGFDKEAIQQYERALKYNPSFPGVYHRLAVLYERQNKPMAALAAYNRAVEATPNNADLLADMGYFYMNGSQWRLAESRLRRAVELNPGLKRAWNNLGITLAQQGRAGEAREAFERAVPAAAAWSNTGVILARRGSYELAREYLTQALRLDPNIAQSRMTLAWVNDQMNKAATQPSKARSGH